MKNIKEKIEFSFEKSEIELERLSSEPSILIVKKLMLALLATYFLLYSEIYLGSLVILILPLAVGGTFFISLMFLITYIDHKMNYIAYKKKKEKYIKKFEKEFNSIKTVLYIYNKLKGTTNVFTDDDFYDFYNTYEKIDFDKIDKEESLELEKIHQKYINIKKKKIAEIIG